MGRASGRARIINMYKFNAKQLAWLEALESGEYEQTTGTLFSNSTAHPDGAYCCLGVGASICGAPLASLRKRGSLLGLSNAMNTLLLYDEYGTLKEDYYFERVVSVRSLAEMNDEYRMSFKEIAAYIRANPENVFKAASSEV